MINKVIKRNKENTPHLKGTLTIELNQDNTCFTFQQVFYFATLWTGILLVHSTFFYQSVALALTCALAAMTVSFSEMLQWHIWHFVRCWWSNEFRNARKLFLSGYKSSLRLVHWEGQNLRTSNFPDFPLIPKNNSHFLESHANCHLDQYMNMYDQL